MPCPSSTTTISLSGFQESPNGMVIQTCFASASQALEISSATAAVALGYSWAPSCSTREPPKRSLSGSATTRLLDERADGEPQRASHPNRDRVPDLGLK